MAGEIQRLSANYVALIQAVPSLADSTEGAADVAPLIQFAGLITPWARVVYDGEVATNPDGIGDTPVQQTKMEWSVFLGAESFDLPAVDGRATIYQMIDDVMAAVIGKTLSIDPQTKPFFVRSGRHAMRENEVIYRIVFRNSFYRQAE